MSPHQVLVDSSVWIEYFRYGHIDLLDDLIRDGIACTNELILTELIPAINHNGERDAAKAIMALDTLPMQIDWEIIRGMQEMNLRNGINQVGIPDLIILQQVIQNKLNLLSCDKHFKLMQEIFQFDLLEF